MPTDKTEEPLTAMDSPPSNLAEPKFADEERPPAGGDTGYQHLNQLRFQSQLLDSVQESIIATDLDGLVTYWGRGAQELYGYTAQEVFGKTITFIVEPEEESVERERMRQVLEVGSWKGEYRQRRKDGSVFWASTVISLVTDESGKPAGFIGIDVDITERKRAAEELGQLRLAIENAMQGISRLDRDGRFIMVKPQYSRMLGYEPQELLGQSWTVTVPQEDQPIAAEGCTTMLREGRATLECRARRKDGSLFDKQLLLVKSFDEQGNHDGHYCFMSDISQRKQAEDQLRAKEAELAHISRLSTMGELVAGVAHEINQPLYAIANFATVAQRKLEAAEGDVCHSVRELNRQISEQAVRAGDIIRRLRVFVGKSDGVRSTFDINAIVRDAVAILSPMTRSTDASTRLELSESPAMVHADRVLLEQVLVNLVRNSIEAVADSVPREITVRTVVSKETVLVSVEDTGTGILDGEPDKLFDAFFTTKESGLGMGLAISRTIVEAHSGSIRAIPRDHGGLHVELELPRCRDNS